MKNKIFIVIVILLFVLVLVFAGKFMDKLTINFVNDDFLNTKLSGDVIIDNDFEDTEESNDIITNSEENTIIEDDSGNIIDSNKKEEINMKIINLTNENFEVEVLNSEQVVLIDFYADWCAPCKMMTPVIEKIASENDNLKVGKINIDMEQDLAIKYNVMSIPTFLVIKNGEVVNRIVGAVDKAELENAIK